MFRSKTSYPPLQSLTVELKCRFGFASLPRSINQQKNILQSEDLASLSSASGDLFRRLVDVRKPFPNATLRSSWAVFSIMATMRFSVKIFSSDFEYVSIFFPPCRKSASSIRVTDDEVTYLYNFIVIKTLWSILLMFFFFFFPMLYLYSKKNFVVTRTLYIVYLKMFTHLFILCVVFITLFIIVRFVL